MKNCLNCKHSSQEILYGCADQGMYQYGLICLKREFEIQPYEAESKCEEWEEK